MRYTGVKPKGRFPAYHPVKNNPQWPNITHFCILLWLDNLRRHEERAADPALNKILEGCCEPEIYNLGKFFLRYIKYILEFKISMDDLHFMQFFNTVEEADPNLSGFCFWKFSLVMLDVIIQVLAPRQEFGDNVVTGFRLEKIHKFNHLFDLITLLQGDYFTFVLLIGTLRGLYLELVDFF